MRVNCKACGRLVADLADGSKVRKGAAMLCKGCADKWEFAAKIAEQAKAQMPGFMSDLFKDPLRR